ncbi:hypothetical protein ACWGKW_27585 [Streptomyces sp. NPDC054766]
MNTLLNLAFGNTCVNGQRLASPDPTSGPATWSRPGRRLRQRHPRHRYPEGDGGRRTRAGFLLGTGALSTGCCGSRCWGLCRRRK